MSLKMEKADAFREDFALQAWWYVREAGEAVAWRYQEAVDATLQLLCCEPNLGRIRRFQHPELYGLRSFPVQRPFQRLLIFSRTGEGVLQAWRLMHSARDLPKRLLEPPGSSETS